MRRLIHLILLSWSLTALAFDTTKFHEGNFEFSIINDSTVSISDIASEELLGLTRDSTLVIPSVTTHHDKKYHVENICRNAFVGRSEIQHLVISEGIRHIDSFAFSGCSNLLSIYLPSTFISTEIYGEGMFLGCPKLCSITVDPMNEEYDSRNNCNAIIHTEDNCLLLGCNNTIIPSTVTTIGPNAFRCCPGIEHLNIPEGVKKIDYFAFRDCINLKEILLPNSLESIGANVFENCMSLEKIVIPANVSQINNQVFGGCYSLKEVVVDKKNKTFDSRKDCNAIINSKTNTIVAGCGNSSILDGIQGIEENAFANTSIRVVHIPKSVRKIGTKAFSGCKFCHTISVDKQNPTYNSADNCNAIIETRTSKLVQGCCSTIFPKGLREIGDFAFYGVWIPPYLIIPEGVETIGSYAFSRFCRIEYMQLPSTLTSIKESAFANCSTLFYLDMSRCNLSIEEFAFAGCSSLRHINLPRPSSQISHLAFSGCPCENKLTNIIHKR